jgi:histidinol-phosphate phosphatase family protein
VIFDVDGTLVTTKSGATFRKTADDWQWLPGRLETLKALHEQGTQIALASNQGGVAFGYMRRKDIINELFKTALEVGNNVYVAVCFTHPKATIEEFRVEDDTRREPGSGMLLECQEYFLIGPIHTLMVGDRPEDEQAAQNAGVAFMWAEEFFSEKETKQ